MIPDAPRCLVTGAAQGIGAAIAAALIADGGVVVGIDRRHLDDARVPIVAADLGDPASRGQAADAAEHRLGGVDVLVNCAGVFREGGVLDSGLSDWRPVWAVDLEAPLELMRRFAPTMADRGWGRIVNVTSVHASAGQPSCLAYDVAKAGLEAATRSAAIDLARSGVLVNAVAPGFVRTAMSRRADGSDETDTPQFHEGYVASGRLPLGRAARAEEIAAAVAYLASARNTYATGTILRVDGGLLATF